MKAAGDTSPGGMAAILALDIPTLDGICIQASAPGEIVQVANDNCPGQVVISGETNALERAMELANEAGAKKVVRLAVSIAAHSPLMTHAQEDFNQAVNEAPITDPLIPIIGNVNAKPLTIGSFSQGYAYPFLGAIDEVKLYNRAKSSREIFRAAREL